MLQMHRFLLLHYYYYYYYYYYWFILHLGAMPFMVVSFMSWLIYPPTN